MQTIGSREAKAFLPQLLERVLRGETFPITRYGKPAAMLVPAFGQEPKGVKDVIAKMKALRKGNVRGRGLSVRNLIDEGRRY